MPLLFRVEIITDFWLGNTRERDRLEDLVLDGKIMLECIINKLCEKLWTALFCLVIGTIGEILYTQLCALGFTRIGDIS